MHHFEHPDGHINFNSDLSGEVQIVNSRGEESWVSGLMLVNFVATYVENYMLPRMREAQARVDDQKLIGKEGLLNPCRASVDGVEGEGSEECLHSPDSDELAAAEAADDLVALSNSVAKLSTYSPDET